MGRPARDGNAQETIGRARSAILSADWYSNDVERGQRARLIYSTDSANGATVDDGLGAANIGFTGEFVTKPSQYRTNTMERIFDPEDISDDGFEVESGNFDYTVKPEEYTTSEGQRLYDYHMAGGGIQNVVDTLLRTQEWTAEISEMATIAQKDLTAREMAALNDPNATKEDYDALRAARRYLTTSLS